MDDGHVLCEWCSGRVCHLRIACGFFSITNRSVSWQDADCFMQLIRLRATFVRCIYLSLVVFYHGTMHFSSERYLLPSCFHRLLALSNASSSNSCIIEVELLPRMQRQCQEKQLNSYESKIIPALDDFLVRQNYLGGVHCFAK